MQVRISKKSFETDHQVRVRPFTEREKGLLAETPKSKEFLGDGSLAVSNTSSNTFCTNGIRKIVRVLDDNVLIFDPPEENPLAKVQKSLLPAGKRFRDVRYAFDRLFGEEASQEDVYKGTTEPLLDSVLQGYNATVFAYGATGCGKTHTISGRPDDPGIIFLTMRALLDRVEGLKRTMNVDISVSYLEIYNEKIRDLLVQDPLSMEKPKSLNICEDAEQNVSVPGLSYFTPTNLEEVMEIIIRGNSNRTMSPTEANAVSSRSHAVLQIYITQTPKSGEKQEESESQNSHKVRSVFSFIDLAGSERASATKNRGKRLVEGANINRSLLALGNCINSLCEPRRRQHVPYRDSKLTRLLKFSLGGNCRTCMIVCISPSSEHYDETHNTLKYGNRAKNIKTKVSRNVVSVDRHVSEYVRTIYELRQKVSILQKRIAEESKQLALNKEVRKISSREIKMLDARSMLKNSFDGSRDLQKSLIEHVRTLRRIEDEITLTKMWISIAKESDAMSGHNIKSVETRLAKLYDQRSLITAKVNPEEICKTFQNSISHIVSSFKGEGADMYADMLQDDVDLLKSIIENQILDAKHESETFSSTSRKLIQNLFLLFPLLPGNAIDVNESLARAFDQLVGIVPSEPTIQVPNLIEKGKAPLLSMFEIPRSPSRFKARSPSKAARVLKKPLKKRVRFSEVPTTSSVPPVEIKNKDSKPKVEKSLDKHNMNNDRSFLVPSRDARNSLTSLSLHSNVAKNKSSHSSKWPTHTLSPIITTALKQPVRRISLVSQPLQKTGGTENTPNA